MPNYIEVATKMIIWVWDIEIKINKNVNKLIYNYKLAILILMHPLQSNFPSLNWPSYTDSSGNALFRLPWYSPFYHSPSYRSPLDQVWILKTKLEIGLFTCLLIFI